MCGDEFTVLDMDHHTTSQTLLMLVKEPGSEAAWHRFETTYRPFVTAVVLQHGLTRADAEELCQDVMVKVWKALGNFLYEPERCRFRTWLARISENTAINFLKRKSTRERAQHLDDGETYLLGLSEGAEVESLAEDEWRLFIAQSAWDAIQDRFNSLQLKVYAEMAAGRTAAEVSQLLDIKENTAYVYRKAVQEGMSLAIKRLNAELDG